MSRNLYHFLPETIRRQVFGNWSHHPVPFYGAPPMPLPQFQVGRTDEQEEISEKVKKLEKDNEIQQKKYRQLEEKVKQLLSEMDNRGRKRDGMNIETDENEGIGAKRARTSSELTHNQSSLEQTNRPQTAGELIKKGIKRELDCGENKRGRALKEPKKEVDEEPDLPTPRDSPPARNIATQENDSEEQSIHYLKMIVKKLEEENTCMRERMRNLENTVEANCHSMMKKPNDMEQELKLRIEKMEDGNVQERLFRLESALICQKTTSKRDRESDDEYELEAKKRRQICSPSKVYRNKSEQMNKRWMPTALYDEEIVLVTPTQDKAKEILDVVKLEEETTKPQQIAPVVPKVNAKTHPMVLALLRRDPNLVEHQKATEEDLDELKKAYNSCTKNIHESTKQFFNYMGKCEICTKPVYTSNLDALIKHTTYKHKAKMGLVPREAVRFWIDKCTSAD